MLVLVVPCWLQSLMAGARRVLQGGRCIMHAARTHVQRAASLMQHSLCKCHAYCERWLHCAVLPEQFGCHRRALFLACAQRRVPCYYSRDASGHALADETHCFPPVAFVAMTNRACCTGSNGMRWMARVGGETSVKQCTRRGVRKMYMHIRCTCAHDACGHAHSALPACQ